MPTERQLRENIKNHIYGGDAQRYELFMTKPVPFLNMRAPNEVIESAEGRERLAISVDAIRTGDFS